MESHTSEPTKKRSSQLIIKRAEAANRLRAAIDILSSLLEDLSPLQTGDQPAPADFRSTSASRDQRDPLQGSTKNKESRSAPTPRYRRNKSPKSEPAAPQQAEQESTQSAIQKELREILNGVRVHVNPDGSESEHEEPEAETEDWENTEQYITEPCKQECAEECSNIPEIPTPPKAPKYFPAGYSNQYNQKANAGTRRTAAVNNTQQPKPELETYSAAKELDDLNQMHPVQNLRAKWTALISNQNKK